MINKGVVLLFGAFNPFTKAHLHIGTLAKSVYPDYEVCYVPSCIDYMLKWKGLEKGDILSGEERYELIKGSISSYDDFFVSDIELKGIVNGKTYNTIKYFKDNLFYTDVVLCMGTDKVSELETWYMGKDLVKDNKFLIITRSGETLSENMTEYTSQYSDNFKEIRNTEFENVSASKVREAVKNQDYKALSDMVPGYVYEKIVFCK